MKNLSIALLLCTTILLQGGTSDAYRAYRKGDKKEAFRLYRQSYKKDGNTKAAYNLAVFYEKGIGTKKDIKKALKLYQDVYDKIYMNLHYYYICSDPMLPYYKKTIRKLAEYKKNGDYAKALKTIRKSCRDKKRKDSDRASQIAKKCPAAASIAPEERVMLSEGCIWCDELKKHPKTVKKYLKLAKKLRFLIRAYHDGNDWSHGKEIKRTIRKIHKVMRPVMSLLRQKQIACVRKAKTISDMNSCSASYYYCADRITECEITVESACFFDPKSAECRAEKSAATTPVSDKERVKEIERIKGRIKKGDFYTNSCYGTII